MKQTIYISILFLFSSCFDLDGNLFNPDNTITEYLFDDYQGEVEIDVVDQTVDADKINQVSLFVGSNQEQIKVVYIGDLSDIDIDTVILYCHGNKDHMDYYWPRTKLLANINGRHNYAVATLDYRGYGLSDGVATEENMYEDVDKVLEWLKTRGLTQDRLFMYGFSLGSAPVCELTANPRSLSPNKIMLESPFASAETMVQDGSGLALPGSFFVNLKVDNAEEIKRISQDLYWLHGEDDAFLNMETHGQVVYDNHQGDYKVDYIIPLADHGDVPFVMGYENYLKSVGDFIRR
jgi:pimeloyl-ACP methyl ester carboxylesterase